MSKNLDFFYEGTTDGYILAGLGLATQSQLQSARTGKDTINQRLANVIRPKLEGGEPVRALVMRDVDLHDRETPASIKQSVEQKLRNLFINLGFDGGQVALSPHPKHLNVYTLHSANPDARIALHLATYRHSGEFIKSTIDDYVLDVALRDSTVKMILQEKREEEKRKLAYYDENLRQRLNREWKIEADGLINKVWQEIPELLQRNGIPSLLEAKIYLHFYAAVLQEPISPSVFAKEALKRARGEDLQEVFASLFAAVHFLSDDSPPA